jgi:crotonobetainyl-CoA:carnitine CoA-transferase CaiB-like acyl-CoA transferase
MCQTFGYSDWLEDRRLATNQDRVEARDWFLPALQKRFSRFTKTELMGLAEKAGIPFAPVARPQDLFEDYHLNQAGCLLETSLPGGDTAKLPKIPLRMNKIAFELRNSPPKVGQGSLSLFKHVGFSDREINELVQEGILDLKEY